MDNLGNNMRIAIASDHGGFSLKTAVIKAISGEFSVEDLGPATDAPCDYPDSAIPVAKAVASGAADFGILVCRSGIGMSMTANRFQNVRATICDTVDQAAVTRRKRARQGREAAPFRCCLHAAKED